WDLSPLSERPLCFSQCLKVIRKVQAGQQWLYMFDFADRATVPWHIAVPTAMAALFICQLHEDLTEKDIAMELV
ncbi:hypothetical protein P691DRAFT_648236, partial [Macrolepiota fuliginosa MF-IS2]